MTRPDFAAHYRRRLVLAVLGVLAPIAPGCGGDDTVYVYVNAPAPVIVTDQSRDTAETIDFLRFLFVPSGVKPTALGLPANYRVFVTASAFFSPPLPAARAVTYPGLEYRADRDLVAMRCSPPQDLDTRLASWPNVFAMLQTDLGSQYTCPPVDGSPENDVYCLVRDYVDTPNSIVPVALQPAMSLGATLFAVPARAEVLRQRYGIYPPFSGLGFAIAGTGASPPLTAAEALRRAVAPEYLIKNASLGAAACFWITVPPYEGRDQAPLDPDFILQQGGDGTCVTVDRLESAKHWSEPATVEALELPRHPLALRTGPDPPRWPMAAQPALIPLIGSVWVETDRSTETSSHSRLPSEHDRRRVTTALFVGERPAV